jgi:hypothetical protein
MAKKSQIIRGNASDTEFTSDDSGSDTEVDAESNVINLASDNETDDEPEPIVTRVSQKDYPTSTSESEFDTGPTKVTTNDLSMYSDTETEAEQVNFQKDDQTSTSDSESDSEQVQKHEQTPTSDSETDDENDDSTRGLQDTAQKSSIDDLQEIINPTCPTPTPIYGPRNFSDSQSLYSAMDYIFGCDSHIPSKPCEALKNLYVIIDFFCLVSDIIANKYVITSRPDFFYEAECVAELLKSPIHHSELMDSVVVLLATYKAEYRDKYIQYAQNTAYPLSGEKFINHMFAMCKTLTLMEKAHVMYAHVCKEHELFRILSNSSRNEAAERNYLEAANSTIEFKNSMAVPKWSHTLGTDITLEAKKDLLRTFYRQSIETIDMRCMGMCTNPEIKTRLQNISKMYNDKLDCISSATDLTNCHPTYINDNHVKMAPVEDSSTTLADILETYRPFLESKEHFSAVTQGKDPRIVELHANFNGTRTYGRTEYNAELVRTINNELVDLKDVKWDMLRKTGCCDCSDANGRFDLHFITLEKAGIIIGDYNNCCIADNWNGFISQL